MTRQGKPSFCSPAQAELLRWSAGLGAIGAEALADHLGCAIHSARGRLAALERIELMRSWRLLQGEPALYTLTRAGVRAAGAEGIEPMQLSPGGARHAVVCCRAAVWLERAFPQARLIGEPELRREQRLRNAAFAGVTLSGGHNQAMHRPDLVLIVDGSAPVAVEVELTVKAPRRLQAICRAWARSREVGGVLYLAAPAVLSPLRRAIDSVDAASRIVVLDLDLLAEAASRDAPFGGAIAGGA